MNESLPTAPSRVIRVIVADDHFVVRAGLRALLDSLDDIDVVGEATNGRGALALVERLTPDVAVLDLAMPQMGGADAAKELVARGSATRVLIVTVHEGDDFVPGLLEAGVAGYLVKSAADQELATAIREIAAGRSYFCPLVSHLKVRCVTPAAAPAA